MYKFWKIPLQPVVLWDVSEKTRYEPFDTNINANMGPGVFLKRQVFT